MIPFRRGTSIDYEFRADPGHLPYVHLLVARNLITGQEIGRWWRRDLLKMRKPPFPTGKDALVVSYGISAEMACFMQLGWKPPEYLLDLYAEFRWLTNGQKLEFAGKDMEKLKKHKNSMLAAAFILGIPFAMSITHKEAMRQMFMTKWEFTPEEEILGGDYCADDTLITQQIYQTVEPVIDWPRALLRGRFGLAVARMERTAVPLDIANVNRITADWPGLLDEVIFATDNIYRWTDKDGKEHGIFVGQEVSDELLSGYARENNMHDRWPKTATGKLSRDKKVMKRLVEMFPKLDILKEVLSTKGATRLLGLFVGPDDRNRAGLIPFRSKTARNQPSSKEFIFGPAVWLRSMIMAPPGYAVAYLDFAAEEVRILAALSKDPNLMADCLSGDPYMAFAKRAGMVPEDATKETHGHERDIVKVLFLSLNYGRTERGLAQELGWPLWQARDLMQRHVAAYPQAHRWLRWVINHASTHGWQKSAFGWRRFVLDGFNPRSIRNWPCQTAGSEIMMLAMIMLTEAGIEVCCPVHDAALIQAPLDQIEVVVEQARGLMEEAARLVTGGFPIPVDHKIYPHGTRFTDKRGTRMWDLVMGLLDDRDARKGRVA